MRRLLCLATVVALISPALSSRAAGEASGAFTVSKLGAIRPTHAIAYLTRDRRNARESRTEVLLTDVIVDAAAIQAAFDPHMTAINDDAIKDRNYVLLWVGADGAVGMNATFSKTMTQFIDDTSGALHVTWTTRSAERLDGRLYSTAPIKTMDGTTYTVDLRFAVDVPSPPVGAVLPAGGGDPGKALLAFFAAVASKNWNAIRAASSPAALQIFDKSYNTPQENASDVADLVDAWIPKQKRVVARGLLSGDSAMLDVEGETFPGMMGLSRVRMVKAGSVWQFDRAAMAGMLP